MIQEKCPLDPITYKVLLKSYAVANCNNEFNDLLKEIEFSEHLKPERKYNLKLCYHLFIKNKCKSDLVEARNIYEEMKRNKIKVDIESTIVLELNLSNSQAELVDIVNELKKKNIPLVVSTFNILLANLFDIREIREVLDLMRAHNVERDYETYVILMDFYSKRKMVSHCEDVIKKMEKAKITASVEIFNGLLKCYVGKKDINASENVVKRMKNRNLSLNADTFNLLIRVYLKNNQDISATEKRMEHRNIAFGLNYFTILITHFVNQQNDKQATTLFEKMKVLKVALSIDIYNLMLTVYSRKKMTPEVQIVHNELLDSGLEPNLLTKEILLSARKQSTEELLKEIFRDAEVQTYFVENNISPPSYEETLAWYNGLIATYCAQGDLYSAENTVMHMSTNSIQPNSITMYPLLPRWLYLHFT